MIAAAPPTARSMRSSGAARPTSWVARSAGVVVTSRQRSTRATPTAELLALVDFFLVKYFGYPVALLLIGPALLPACRGGHIVKVEALGLPLDLSIALLLIWPALLPACRGGHTVEVEALDLPLARPTTTRPRT